MSLLLLFSSIPPKVIFHFKGLFIGILLCHQNLSVVFIVVIIMDYRFGELYL